MVYVLPRLRQADPDNHPHLLVSADMAWRTERFHIFPLVAKRVLFRQAVMRLDRRSASALLADRMRIEEQSVALLT